MGITVLGPVAVDDTTALAPRDRVVLAVLAMRPGEAVAPERLAEALWGDAPPASWSKVVPGCVMRLRRALGAGAIATTPQGYRLTMPAEAVDAHRFEQLVGRGRELLARGEADRAAHTLSGALKLWQGRALAELDGWEPGRAEAARLQALRLDAEENRWDAELAAGRHGAVLIEATAGITQAPLRERRWGQLALAEYRSGRQGDALRTIQRARATLAGELGLDPGPDLAALERAILVQDPDLSVTSGAPPSAVCPYLGLVPYDVGDAEVFFGRDHDVAECVRRLTVGGAVTIVGPSGSGKSSLVRAGLAAALLRADRAVRVITPGSQPLHSLADTAADTVLVVDQCEEAVVLCRDARERAAFFDAIVAHAGHDAVVVAIRADRLGDLAEHRAFARLAEGSLYLLGAMDGAELRAAIEGPALEAGLLLEPGLVEILVREVEGEPGALPLLSHALRQTWQLREGRTLTVEGYRRTGGIRGAVAQSAEALYEALPPEQRKLLRALLLRLVATTPDGEAVRTPMPRRLVAIDADHEALVERLVSARLATAGEDTVELAHESLARAWPRLRGWLDEDVNGQRILRHLVGAADAWDALGRPPSELYRGIRLAQALEWRQWTAPDLGHVEDAFLDAASQQEEDERREAQQAARQRGRARRRARIVYLALAGVGVAVVLGATFAIREASDARSDRVADARHAGALALDTADPRLALLLAVEGARLEANTETRANLHTTLQRNGGLVRTAATGLEITTLAVSPTDGTLAAAGFDDDGQGRLSFYRPDTLARAGSLDMGDGDDGWPGTVWRPDGAQLALTRSGGPTPRPNGPLLVDAATLEPAAVQLGGIPASIDTDVAYSADGRYLAASFDRAIGTGNGTVLVWRVSTPEAPILRIDTVGQWVPGVALSPDGRRLYVWEHNDWGGPLTAYDVPSGEVAAQTGPQVTAQQRGCCPAGPGDVEVNPDGSTVALAQRDGVVIYDAANLLERARLSLAPAGVEFSPDGSLATFDGSGVTVWARSEYLQGLPPEDVGTWEPRPPFASGLDAAAFDTSGATLYTAFGDSLAQWDLAGDRQLVEVVNEPGGTIADCPRGVDGPSTAPGYGAVVDRQGHVVAWDAEPGRILDIERPGNFYAGIWDCLEASAWRPPDFTTLAVAAPDARVSLVNRSSGDVVAEARLASDATAIGFTGGGDRLLVGLVSGDLVVLEGDSLEPVGPRIELHRRIVGMHPTADGQRAAVLMALEDPNGPFCEDCEAEEHTERYALVDLSSGAIVEEGNLDITPVAAAISPDGTRLAVADTRGVVGVRRLDGPGWVRPPFAANESSALVRTASFAPDGSSFVLAYSSGRVDLWDTQTGTPIAQLRPGEPGVGASAVFDPDGHTVIVATSDGAVFRWDTRIERAIERACAVAGRNMTPTEWPGAFPDRPYRETCPSS